MALQAIANTTTTLRDRAIREVLGHDAGYSNLSSDQQADITAAIKEAWNRGHNFAKWFAEIDPDDTAIPAELQELMQVEATARVAKVLRGWEGYEKYAPTVDESYQQAMLAYAPAWTDATHQSPFATTAAMRQSIMRAAMRMERHSLIPPAEADRFAAQAWHRVWNWRGWNFRKYRCTFTLATNDSHTITVPDDAAGSAMKMDAPAQEKLQYGDDYTARLQFARDNDYEVLKAYYENLDTSTGRPVVFRLVQTNAGDRSIECRPQPDVEYTAYGMCFVQTPDYVDANLAMLPNEFHPILLDLGVAFAISEYGATRAGLSKRQQSERELDSLGTEQDNMGFVEIDQSPKDVYGDTKALESSTYPMIGGNY